jgi:hypothetical protein
MHQTNLSILHPGGVGLPTTTLHRLLPLFKLRLLNHQRSVIATNASTLASIAIFDLLAVSLWDKMLSPDADPGSVQPRAISAGYLAHILASLALASPELISAHLQMQIQPYTHLPTCPCHRCFRRPLVCIREASAILASQATRAAFTSLSSQTQAKSGRTLPGAHLP